MLTVGLAHDLFISSAAVVRDGEVIAAIAEERLNRQKMYKGFPRQAVQRCLELAGASLRDVSIVACGWNPARHMEFPNYRWSSSARWRPEYLYSIPNMLMGTFGQPSGEWLEQTMEGMAAHILYVDHQLTHAANAFYLSPFDHAAVFTADGRGERDTAYWGVADASGFHRLGNALFPDSLGLVYGAVTQFLGFKPDSDEWKVMALASYGRPNSKFYRSMRELIKVDENTGNFAVDVGYFGYHHPESFGGRLYSPTFVDVFGRPRGIGDPIENRHQDIAAALQRVFEESMATCLMALYNATGEETLVLAGGCMMNSVYNGKITRTTPFKRVFISSCPDDSGTSVGAALYAYHHCASDPRRPIHTHNYWGPAYDDGEIERTLQGYNLPYKRLDNPPHAGAQLLDAGELVGWFQGRMEFGQRALGNRSILVDPRRPDGRDVINSAVKYRESFRPFAPAILVEHASDYFDIGNDERVPFMEKVYAFREHVRQLVPSVVHVDGTGRLQTVERDQNPRFYDLIAEFKKLTGVPVVLNTSFNLNGEPIVCSPADAIRTFYSCGLDVLIMGNYLVRKG